MRLDNIFDYDKGYTKLDAEEIGFCSKCNSKKCSKAPLSNFGKNVGKEAVKRMVRDFYAWKRSKKQ